MVQPPALTVGMPRCCGEQEHEINAKLDHKFPDVERSLYQVKEDIARTLQGGYETRLKLEANEERLQSVAKDIGETHADVQKLEERLQSVAKALEMMRSKPLTRVGYVADVEGNLDYFVRYVNRSKVLKWKEEAFHPTKATLEFRDEESGFVFGGDSQVMHGAAFVEKGTRRGGAGGNEGMVGRIGRVG